MVGGELARLFLFERLLEIGFVFPLRVMQKSLWLNNYLGLISHCGEYSEKLAIRSAIFQDETHSSRAIHNTFITTLGLAKGGYHGGVQSEITLDDLFYV
jgi:hypothetical protein